MRLHLRFGLVAGLAALAATAVACGGDSLEKVDSEDWVADVCDEAVDFDADFADIAADLDVIQDGDADEIKDAVDEFVDDATKLIDDFVKNVEDVGQPDIGGGSDVIKAFRDHAKDQKKVLTDFKSDVAKLDDDDDDDFRDDVFELLEDSDEFDLRDRLEDIDENEVDDLIDEIDNDPDCSFVLFNS